MSTLFSGHYLRNRSTLDIGVLGYIGIVEHNEHYPEVFHIPPGTTCIYIYIFTKESTHTQNTHSQYPTTRVAHCFGHMSSPNDLCLGLYCQHRSSIASIPTRNCNMNYEAAGFVCEK